VFRFYTASSDWRQAGLDKQSYIDTGTIRALSSTTLNIKTPIGNLTKKDRSGLIKFING
jgi:hypothetical protein